MLRGASRWAAAAAGGARRSCARGSGGPLLGGTLTQLTGVAGTPYAFDRPPGFVLFLDDVGERPYRIDRMLTQLRASRLLGRARAIVFGELPRLR